MSFVVAAKDRPSLNPPYRSVTSKKSLVLVLDAGHIAITSDLADKRLVEQASSSGPELERLMYDRFSVRLDDAQLLIGDDIERCVDALGGEDRSYHVVERINMLFNAQNAIVNLPEMTRFKVSGELPRLTLNVSDRKYKSLMRIIDVAIPKFGTDEDKATSAAPRPNIPPSTSGAFRRGQLEEYVLSDDDGSSTVHGDHESTDGKGDDGDKFYEARDDDETDPQRQAMHQKTFQFAFAVKELRANLSRSGEDGTEAPLAAAVLDGFALDFALRKYDMAVDVILRALSLQMTGQQPRAIITSEEQSDEDLVKVHYLKVQKTSPDFLSKHEGVDQSIETNVSTIRVLAEPEIVLKLYDFIMTTFVSAPDAQQEQQKAIEAAAAGDVSTDKLRIRVKLRSMALCLQDQAATFATLTLSAGDVALLMRAGTMRLSASVGNLTLVDETDDRVAHPDFKQLLSIEGKELADFSYETFDANDAETFPGYNSMVKLHSGSLKLTFMDGPIRRINRFLTKLAELKAVYDAASQAAMQRAAEVTRMRFDIAVSSPIVIIPRNGPSSREILYARLGEIATRNQYFHEGDDDSHLSASLSGISVATGKIDDGTGNLMHLLNDTDIKLELKQRTKEAVAKRGQAEIHIVGSTNIFDLTLTQAQYALLLDLSRTVPQALQTVDDTSSAASRDDGKVDTATAKPQIEQQAVSADAARGDKGLKMTFAFEIPGVSLELYDAQAVTAATLTGHSIARFKLSTVKVGYETRRDGSSKADVSLRAFSISNTRAGQSAYRELIPEIGKDSNQFSLQYSSSGGPDAASQLLLEVDSPQVVLAADPLKALLDFATSPSARSTDGTTQSTNAQTVSAEQPAAASQGTFSYRIEVKNAIILVMADDADVASQAIILGMNNAVLTQQSKMTLVLHGLGMSFGQMDQLDNRVSFLDELDITVALDSSTARGQSHTNIELMVQTIIFRASLTDLLLLSDIVTKASTLAAEAFGGPSESAGGDASEISNKRDRRRSSVSLGRQSLAPRGRDSVTASPAAPASAVQVVVSREALRASFDGFQLVLIGDVHQLPLVHLTTQAFNFHLNDWSGDMSAQTTLSTAINYYNLKISHWEPLMDPWDFSLRVGKTSNRAGGTTAVDLVSRKRLELNASAAFIELAITTVTLWSKEGERIKKQGRGDDAPFLVRNRTGYSMLLWSDSGRSSRGKSVEVKRLSDGSAIPWRFQDYKKLRENISSSSHNAFGVQLENTSWERVRNISADREGDHPYVLKPRINKVAHRLVCDIQLKDNVKIVTFRSSFKIENLTHLPMELVMIDANGKAASPVNHIPPGDDFPLPIEAAYEQRFRMRPDRGFNYSWSGESYSWQDFLRRPVRAVTCKNRAPNEAAFRFQAATLYDKDDPLAKQYPRLSVRLRAPVEIENLLPYNIRYRVYDKSTRSNTTSFLIKGGCSPVHTVDLDHLLLLSVDAQDSGLKPSEFAIINTDNPDDFRTEKTLILHDKKDAKLELRLHYFKYPDSGGAFKVQVYSPYVLLNKTGLPLSLAIKSWSGQKTVAGLDSASGQDVKPLMISFPNDEKKDRLLVRFGKSEWSRPLSVEAVGADSEVRVATVIDGQPSPELSRGTLHSGFSYAEGLGKYKLSKVITLAPRFLLRNDCGYPIKVRQYRTHLTMALEPAKRVPWHTFAFNAPTQYVLALDGLSAPWSQPINVADVGKSHVVLREPGPDGKITLIRVDTRLEGATVFLFFSEEKSAWPLRLRNETNFRFKFCQTEDKTSSGLAQDRQMIAIDPHASVDYAWDSPAASNKRIRLQSGEHERIVDIMEIGVQPPFKFAERRANAARKVQAVSLDVRAEGSSQVLVIANYNEEESVYKPKRSTAALNRSDSVDSLNAMSFETVSVTDHPTLTLNINFEGVGISVVNRHLQELVYVSFRGIKLAFSNYPQYYDANLDCKWIQIDNQLFGGLFPIILYPTVVPKDGKELESHPTLQLSLALLKDDQHGVTYVKYATILLQAMTIELDEDFLFALLEFSKFEDASWQEPTQDILIQNPGEIPEPKEIAYGPNVYFEDLALQPLQLELSFMRTDRVNVDNKVSTRNPVNFFINAITMALGNVNAAPVLLNALIIHNARLSIPSLQERVMFHYREQFMAQLFRVLGSADFLGNPVGLFNNVSSGFQDIFYEPYQGMVMHGNKELGIGIARGATSFAKKSIFGVTDSLTKVTSSIGKGLSAATMDSEYQSKRRMAARRNKPKHALYGFATGANAFATSVASGFEGLALKPIEGAETGGVGGFFKGIGKGVVGAVTKPMVGVTDLVSASFEGIRNTTTVFDQNDIDRVRMPRFIADDGILRPFNEREALGQSWLKSLEDGKYIKESYVAHLGEPQVHRIGVTSY